jgi:hypothetical protein
MPETVSSTTLTEFLQHSGQYLPRLAEGELLLRRRDGEDLIMMSQAHWRALTNSLLALNAACSPDDRLTDEVALQHAVPWAALLRSEDRVTFLTELRKATIAALEFGRLTGLVELLDEWRATALATWDEEQRAQQSAEPDSGEPALLPRP